MAQCPMPPRARRFVFLDHHHLAALVPECDRELPAALTGVYQGLLLFFLLACDTFIHYRLRWRAAGTKAA